MSLLEELHRAHKERVVRMSQPKPKPVKVEPLPVQEFNALDSWVKRQKDIPLPGMKDPWFSMVGDFDESGPTIGKIQFAVAQYFQMSRRDLVAAGRMVPVAYARHIAFYLCKTLTLRSLPEIGRKFGGRDHTTVLHGYRKIERLMKTDWVAQNYDSWIYEAGAEIMRQRPAKYAGPCGALSYEVEEPKLASASSIWATGRRP
jgi:hypothetical protein